MKKNYWILSIFLFGMCTQKPETSLLPEVNNKPTSKATVSLNSEQKGDWTIYFGLQDKNAPQNPDELKKSDFKKKEATVPFSKSYNLPFA